MITPNNMNLFNQKPSESKKKADKHAFYFEMNRQLSNLGENVKVFLITFRVESVLHEVSRELNENGFNTSLVLIGEKPELFLRILIKD